MRNAKYWHRRRAQLKSCADATTDAHTRRMWARAYNVADRYLVAALRASVVLLVLLVGGCSGGFSASVGAGGSFHNPNHKDLANVVRQTPIVTTSTGRAFALPMVGE